MLSEAAPESGAELVKLVKTAEQEKQAMDGYKPTTDTPSPSVAPQLASKSEFAALPVPQCLLPQYKIQ